MLAFAGDVTFTGASAYTATTATASAGAQELGSAFGQLAAADVAVVNLETAVGTGGPAADKQYTFEAPPQVMGALAQAGVDAVSMANNHGLDHGDGVLTQSLAAGAAAHLPVLGAGQDLASALAPLRIDPNGVPVSVLAATDVLDDDLAASWTAIATTPGLASTKDPAPLAALLAAVRTERAAGRVVVVYLHWGVELHSCPSARQQDLAAQLLAAGAQVVVGSHAHVLEPATGSSAAGGSLVAYGLGNFHFNATSAATSASGVLDVVVDAAGVVSSTWHPAVITAGRPQLVGGGGEAVSALAATCPGFAG